MRNNILVLVLFCCSYSIGAQENGDDKFGSWALFFGTHRISDEFSIYTELELNDYLFFSDFNQFWAIAALNYHITDKAVGSFGYGYFINDPTFLDTSGDLDIYENRFFEQFTLNDKIGNFRLQHRYRLEHRFLNGPNGTATRHRFRYRLQLNHPLYRGLFINVMDEIFINLQEPIFDQNRLFVGLGYHFSENISFQAGYLKLHFTGVNYDRIQFILIVNTDLRKKREE